MPSEPVFTITYWGTTGTLTAPLRPGQVTDKIVRAVARLLSQGCLADLPAGPGREQAVRRAVEQALPFHLRSTYGGNTTCLEVQTPDALLILDCGSGCRELGIALERRWNAPGYAGPRSAHVLISHAHMDHTYATPYVDPYFDPRNHFTLWGSQTVLKSFEAVLSPKSPLSHTYFPPTINLLRALRDYRVIEAGADFPIGSTRVRTYGLNHPGGCLAFRLENAGRVFVFATDHEHPEVPDRNLAAFAAGADLLYTDGQYLGAEYEGKEGVMREKPFARRGWGHSTVEASVATAVAAGVRELHVGHREPKRDDDDLARVESHLQQVMAAALAGAGLGADSGRALIPYEGLTVNL
jgi:phosphoribosyl 1,2-cyclic phosphodiesterase